jgi:hypothetical protein
MNAIGFGRLYIQQLDACRKKWLLPTESVEGVTVRAVTERSIIIYQYQITVTVLVDVDLF